jgi:hypothetical protein
MKGIGDHSLTLAVIAAMGPLGILLAACATGSGNTPTASSRTSSESGPRNGSRPTTLMIDADNCPHPERGVFQPRRFVAFESAVRDMFFGKYEGDPVLFVVVQPSFANSFLVAMDRQRETSTKPAVEQDGFVVESEPPRYRYKLRVIRARRHLWADMMREMQKRQGNTIRLGEAQQKQALDGKSLETTEQAREIDAALAEKLVAVWTGVLHRTQFVQEVLKAPDGREILVAKADGTTYNLYAQDMSAETWSPTPGSVLADFVSIVEGLAKLPDAPKARQDAASKEIGERADHLLVRLAKNEPCLKPYDGHQAGK